MKCRNCGAEIAESNKFCGICGAPNILEENAQNNPADENGEYGIDDILNSYGGKSEEKAKSDEAPEIGSESGGEASQNAVGTADSGEAAVHGVQPAENIQEEKAADTDGRKENGGFSHQRENIPQNYQEGSPQYNPNNMPYGNYPPNGQNGYYGSNMNGFPQNPAFVPYGQSSGEAGKKEKRKKEKRVVSLGVAVFCIIVTLIMSAFCGFLLETCLRNDIDPFSFVKNGSVVQNINSQNTAQISKYGVTNSVSNT